MGKEMDNAWYDKQYRAQINKNSTYNQPPEKVVYYPVWKRACAILQGHIVADFGCGVGQFVEVMKRNGVVLSYAIDFSKVAIDHAIKKHKGMEGRFMVGDLLDKSNFFLGKYTACTMFEVLEHIERDIDVISHVPRGMLFLFSVPNYSYKSHIRHFSSEDVIISRYGGFVDIISIEQFKVSMSGKLIYLINGRKK